MDDSLDDLLRSARWLPPTSPADSARTRIGLRHWGQCCAGNLLADIAFRWRQSAEPDADVGPGQPNVPFRLWLEQRLAEHASLTWDVPAWPANSWRASQGGQQTGSWIGRRLLWWPRGVPPGCWLGIVSSRLSRRLDQNREWFAAFRAVCGKVAAQDGLLFTGANTTTGRFVERAAARFGVRTLVLHAPRNGDSVVKWLTRLRGGCAGSNPHGGYQVFLSPPLSAATPDRSTPLDALPLSDRAVIAWSDQLFVSYLRPGGNVERLVRARLLASPASPPTVFLALGAGRVARRLADDLLALGAVGWILLPHPNDTQSAGVSVTQVGISHLTRADSVTQLATRLANERPGEWNYLTHCTHGPGGPWPDQSEEAFLDELIEQPCPSPRSVFHALVRILEQQRIIASAAGLRGGTRAVCFTAVPLAELPALREYLPHRNCWRFEPYGIGIQRDWLMAHGARAVIYGDDHTWRTLPVADRSFFQLRGTQSGSQRRDWTVEQEWRLLGDLDLSLVPDHAAFVFVAHREEAERLAGLSRWPVTNLL